MMQSVLSCYFKLLQPIIMIMVGTGNETLKVLKMKVTVTITWSILPLSSDKLLGRAQQGG